MGNWIKSTLFRFDSLLFPRKNYCIDYSIPGSQQRYTISLIRVAAELISLQRMDRSRKNDSDSEFSSDDECPRMSREEEERMFEQERMIAFSGRCTIGDQQSMDSLKNDIRSRCVAEPSTSIYQMNMARETGSRKKSQYCGQRSRNAMTNSYLPNRRKMVDKVQCKSFCCKYTADGRVLVTASQDERIRFYQKNSALTKHVSQYKKFRELKVDVCSWSILDFDMSYDASTLAYATWKDAVFVNKLSENDENHPDNRACWTMISLGESEHNTAVFCIRFSEDGRQIVAGSSDYGIHVLDVERRVRLRTVMNAHEDDVNTVCFAAENPNMIYSGGDDGLVKVWDRRAWRDGDVVPVGVFAGHRDGITSVDSRGDGRYLLSNCKDQTIKIWDLRRFSCSLGINGTRNCVKNQSWDYRWQPAPPGLCQPVFGDTSVVTLRGHSVLHTLVRAKFSPERTGRRYIYTGCARGEIVVYDVLTGAVSKRLKGHQSVVRDIDWHPDENEIVACSWDGTTSVWSWDERADRMPPPGSDSPYGEDDSCDEWYKPIARTQRRSRKCASSSSACRPSGSRYQNSYSHKYDDDDD